MEPWKIFGFLIFLESVVSYPVASQLQTHQDDYRLNNKKLNSVVDIRKHLSVIKIAINYNSSNNNDISITRSNLQKNPLISNSNVTSTISTSNDPLAQIINKTLSQLLESSNRQSIFKGLTASTQLSTYCASKTSGESTSTIQPEPTNHATTINDITTENIRTTSSIQSNSTSINPTIVLPTTSDEKTTHVDEYVTTAPTVIGDQFTTADTVNSTESTSTNYYSTSDLSTTEHQQITTHLPTTNNNSITPDLPVTTEQITTDMQTTKDDSTKTTVPISDSTITEPGSLIPSVNNISIIEIAINYIKSNNNSVIIDV